MTAPAARAAARSRFFVVRAVVGAVVVVGGAGGCYFGDGTGLPCVDDANCPFTLQCQAGTCQAPPTTAPPAVVVDAFAAGLTAGSTPRVVGGEVLYVADCGLARFRGGAGDDGVPLFLDDDDCVTDLDAVVDGDGVVRGVISGGGAVRPFVRDGDGVSVDAFAVDDDVRDGGRVVRDGAGVVHASFVHKPAGAFEELEDVVVRDGAAPVLFGPIADRALSQLTPALNDDGDLQRFLIERQTSGVTQLTARDNVGLGVRTIDNDVDGALDAVRCGAATFVVYRRDRALLVREVTADGVAGLQNVVDDVGVARAAGDVALACDDERVVVAYVNVDSGAVGVGVRVGVDVWDVSEFADDAVGGISIDVDGGVVSAAWAAGGGALHTTRLSLID